MSPRIVPERQARTVRKASQQSRELTALLKGRMVHFDDERDHFSTSQIRRYHGLRLRYRGDGRGGRYWWTEPIETP